MYMYYTTDLYMSFAVGCISQMSAPIVVALKVTNNSFGPKEATCLSIGRLCALSPENNLTYSAHPKVIFTTNDCDYLFTACGLPFNPGKTFSP